MNIEVVVFFAMIFCHLLADFTLQGWLASAKQKSWWKANAPDPLYKFDYITALICHSVMWSIFVMAPLIICGLFEGRDLGFIWLFLPFNISWHALIDDLKANKGKINLSQDQSFHMLQIILTWSAWLIERNLAK